MTWIKKSCSITSSSIFGFNFRFEFFKCISRRIDRPDYDSDSNCQTGTRFHERVPESNQPTTDFEPNQYQPKAGTILLSYFLEPEAVPVLNLIFIIFLAFWADSLLLSSNRTGVKTGLDRTVTGTSSSETQAKNIYSCMNLTTFQERLQLRLSTLEESLKQASGLSCMQAISSEQGSHNSEPRKKSTVQARASLPYNKASILQQNNLKTVKILARKNLSTPRNKAVITIGREMQVCKLNLVSS